ncbi:hypothetical protein [Microlunatus soli]|uniref:Uncharacterized protein n=1 Tax=Microlunatus soli TaxID=630515 RepID=A0A1H1NC58_9ACTN|nr:hypothetical protein [Microlunatus soli]SDR96512.1 hypothetical protein SAMN04489812_0465 [Microlunatus soli]
MNTGAKVAAAVSAGYLLGRTKKLKLAIAVGLILAGRKLPKDPLELAGQGLKTLQQSDQFAGLREQVTGSLADAGKRAASHSAEQWLGKMTDRLRDGTPSSESESEEDEADDQDAGAEDDDTDQSQEDVNQSEDDMTDSNQDDDDSDSDSDQSGRSRSSSAKTGSARSHQSGGSTAKKPSSRRKSSSTKQSAKES